MTALVEVRDWLRGPGGGSAGDLQAASVIFAASGLRELWSNEWT